MRLRLFYRQDSKQRTVRLMYVRLREILKLFDTRYILEVLIWVVPKQPERWVIWANCKFEGHSFYWSKELDIGLYTLWDFDRVSAIISKELLEAEIEFREKAGRYEAGLPLGE